MDYHENLWEQLKVYAAQGRKVQIDNMPEELTLDAKGNQVGGGKIISVHNDYLVFEMATIKEKQEESTRQRMMISKGSIEVVNEGVVKISVLDSA